MKYARLGKTAVVKAIAGFIGGAVGMAIQSIAVEWRRSAQCRAAMKGLLLFTVAGALLALLVLLVLGGHMS